LRAAQFVRSSGTEYGIEIYHDRIGETIVSLLDDGEQRQIHRRLAQAIEARGLDDPESLYEDYRGAGESDRAASHAEAAAKRRPAPWRSIGRRSISAGRSSQSVAQSDL